MERYLHPALVMLFLVLVSGCVVPATHTHPPMVMNQSPPHPDLPNMTTGRRAIAMAVPVDEIDTPYPEARDLLIEGLTYNAVGGRYLEALECYDQALAIDPDFAIAWQAKGVALYNLGQYDKAIECYDRALSLDPGNEGVETLKNMAMEDRVNAGRY